MVKTDAGGSSKIDLGNIQEDVIAAVDDTYDLGSASKKWAALWVAIAMVTSLTIGGVIGLSNIDSVLFINASTHVNGSLEVDVNISAINITADYFFGNGSQLTDLTLTETDPLWTANQSNYSTTSTILGWNYWNSTWAAFNETYADTKYLQSETDPLWTANQSSYFNKSDILGFSYYNLTDFDIADYYLKSNPFSFYNSTTLVETDPLWTGNETNVAFKNAANVFTANQNLTGQNVSAIDCMVFDSGGKICSGS